MGRVPQQLVQASEGVGTVQGTVPGALNHFYEPSEAWPEGSEVEPFTIGEDVIRVEDEGGSDQSSLMPVIGGHSLGRGVPIRC
jgi:hypothetical protein